MNRRPSFSHLLAAATLGFLVMPAVDAQAAEEFRIRKATLEGNDLLLYHEHVGEGGSLSVAVGGKPCETEAAETQKPGRGGDQLTTLIVIDRGGKRNSDMGKHSDDIIGAVQQFIAQTLQESPGEKFAIKEAPGRGRPGAKLAPTNESQALDDFLEQVKGSEPAGVGADIYGTTSTALSLLDGTDTKLRAVIMISDGLDPTGGSETSNHPQVLVDAAERKGIPLSAIHINRAGPNPTAKRAARAQKGRVKLGGVVDKTHGELRSVPIGPELQARVLGSLKEVAGVYAALVRTRCKLCGEMAAEQKVPVEMAFGEEGSQTRSRTDPPVRVLMSATDFGPCPGDASEGGTEACSTDADCGDGDGCQDCIEGACESPKCEEDVDCFEGCSCQDGRCKKAKTLADHVPLIVGILGILAAILIGVSLSRRQKRAQAALQADIAAKEERSRADAQVARQRADEEAQRHAAERAQMEMKLAEQKDQVEALAEQLNPVFYRLVSADGSGLVNLEVRKGTQALGGDPGRCALVIDQPTVSGHHATLSVDDQGVVSLTDENSSNHTYVNDFQLQPHAPVEVRPGDMIAFSRNVVVTLTDP